MWVLLNHNVSTLLVVFVFEVLGGKTNNSIKHSYNAGFWLYKSLITFSTTLYFFCCNIYDKMSVFSLVRGRCVSRALNFLLYNKIQSNFPTDTPIYLNLKVKNLAWYERVTVEGSDSCGTETVFQLTLWGLIHVYTFHVCKCSRVRSGLSDVNFVIKKWAQGSEDACVPACFLWLVHRELTLQYTNYKLTPTPNGREVDRTDHVDFFNKIIWFTRSSNKQKIHGSILGRDTNTFGVTSGKPSANSKHAELSVVVNPSK